MTFYRSARVKIQISDPALIAADAESLRIAKLLSLLDNFEHAAPRSVSEKYSGGDLRVGVESASGRLWRTATVLDA